MLWFPQKYTAGKITGSLQNVCASGTWQETPSSSGTQLFADVWRERRCLQRCGEMSCASAGLSHRRMANQPRLVPVSPPQMSHQLMSANTRGDGAGARCKLNSCSSNGKRRLILFFSVRREKQVSCGGRSEDRSFLSGVLTVLRLQSSANLGHSNFADTLICSVVVLKFGLVLKTGLEVTYYGSLPCLELFRTESDWLDIGRYIDNNSG